MRHLPSVPFLTLVKALGLVCAFITLLGLGFWQLERKAWKEELIADIQSQIESPAIELPHDLSEKEDLNYQPVVFTGRFLNDKAVYLSARSYRGRSGLHVFVPLELEGGKTIFVNRGWVPPLPKDQLQTLLDEASAKTKDNALHGILRETRKNEDGSWSAKNDPNKGFWIWADIPAFAKIAGLGNTITNYYIDESLDQHTAYYPVGGQTNVSLPNNHVQYAITWFSLAVVLVLIVWIYRRQQALQKQNLLEI